MFNPIRLSSKYINKVLSDGFRTSSNKNFNIALINEFCKKIGVKYGITLSSGTSALHVALLGLNLKKNDEVIMPSITMSAVAYAIILAGGKPIFADVDKDTLNIDPKSVESKINKKTKAIISVALFGLPPNYTELKKIISKNKNKIFLIEDNAECVFAMHNGKYAGSFGDMSTFSFQSSKTLTCGEGGILLTNNKKLYLTCKMKSNLGYYINNHTYKKNRLNLQRTNFKRHEILGFNYRLSELGAATVYGQIKKSAKIIKFRLEAGEKFKKIIINYTFVTTQKIAKNTNHSYWAFPLIFKKKNYCDLFTKLFNKNGGDFYYGCWMLPYKEKFYKDLKFYKPKCKNAESIQERTIQLKTNYFNSRELKKQTEILDKTLKQIGMKYNAR